MSETGAVDNAPVPAEVSVLVLDGHASAALACVQSLGRAGYRVFLGSAEAGTLAWRSRYPRECLTYPDPKDSRDAFVHWVRALVAGRDLDYVLPVTDTTIHPLMEAGADSFAARVILPPPDAFPYAFDKDRTDELARRTGVPVPASTRVTSLPDSADGLGRFPLYLKPAVSKAWAAGRGASLVPKLVRTEAELAEWMGPMLGYGPVLVQEYVPGRGVGVEVLCDRGEVVLAFAHERVHEYPLTGGRSTYRRSIEPPPALLDATKRLLRAAGWHGVAMVEFKYDGRNFALVEINGRFWGSLALAMYAGVDFPAALLDLCRTGQRPRQPDYRVGVYARCLLTDVTWFRDNFRADHGDPLQLTRGRVRSLLEPLRLLAGREHWDHFSLRDPGPGLWQLRLLLGEVLGRVARRVERAVGSIGAARRSRRRVRRRAARRILVLCHGNIYRSPFVAEWLRERLPADFQVCSAGFHPAEGRSPMPEYLPLAREHGVELTEHRSLAVDDGLLEWADLVVVMDWRNRRELRAHGRHILARTVWLGAFDDAPGLEIRDPYGRPEPEVRQILARLERCSQRFLGELQGATATREGNTNPENSSR